MEIAKKKNVDINLISDIQRFDHEMRQVDELNNSGAVMLYSNDNPRVKEHHLKLNYFPHIQSREECWPPTYSTE